jgi:hypothetical protein
VPPTDVARPKIQAKLDHLDACGVAKAPQYGLAMPPCMQQVLAGAPTFTCAYCRKPLPLPESRWEVCGMCNCRPTSELATGLDDGTLEGL